MQTFAQCFETKLKKSNNMKRYLALALLMVCACTGKAPQDLTQWVDPMIGTDYVGHTHPAATAPFGLVQVGPDTGIITWEHCSGYCYSAPTIMGFSHTHLSGTGVPDMGDIMLMPVVGDVPMDAGDEADSSTGYRSKFSHDTEKAAPGYYRVHLDDYDIDVEIAATSRVGYHKYTFPAEGEAGLVIDLKHGIGDSTIVTELNIIDPQTITGKRRSAGWSPDHTYYFYMKLSEPVSGFKTLCDGELSDKSSVIGKDTKAKLEFAGAKGKTLYAKVALSTTGVEGAKLNLETEVGDKSFETVLGETTEAWNKCLSVIDIEPLREEQRMAFYTSLYHATIVPNTVSDVNGDCGLPDGTIVNDGYDTYTNISTWDTYRATHPFYILAYPQMNDVFAKDMLAYYQRNGILYTNNYAQAETYCMIGNHIPTVLADEYFKGRIPEYKSLIAESIYKSLTTDHEKSNFTLLDKYGYLPTDKEDVESVSRTLEFCYDDYCAAKVAQAQGDTAQAAFFAARSDNFKNLFDPSTKLFRPKYADGRWQDPFDPFLLCHASTSGGDYTEANAWVYVWHIQHDVPALMDLMGGKEEFDTMLDKFFTLTDQSLGTGFTGDSTTGLIGQYCHGNEPSHHVPYFYDYTDNAYKCQDVIRYIFDEFYKPTCDGLSGNDDCGQMSTWYMFSAMGIYPVDPISGQYLIGAPQFKGMTLHLENGKAFTMKAPSLSEENKYVKSASLNGVPLKTMYITYDDILDGSTLEFEMASTPQPNFWN